MHIFLVNATSLTIGKSNAKAQSISVGAALSISAINDDLSAVLSGQDEFSKLSDKATQEEKDWKPSNLYIFCDKAVAKVSAVNFNLYHLNLTSTI